MSTLKANIAKAAVNTVFNAELEKTIPIFDLVSDIITPKITETSGNKGK